MIRWRYPYGTSSTVFTDNRNRSMTREEIISRSFRECPKTIGQVSRETGIPSREVRKVVSGMEKARTIWRLYRRIWPLSEFMFYSWTTNMEVAFGYRILVELSGKNLSTDEQIETIKSIRSEYVKQ